jgi:acetylornithine aminotransferase/acetylornithine/N-succinyldiaminopimelate aminotransferase
VPATAEYLLGLRQLCDEKKLLLLMDGVQCGHFRTGRFQSFQRILEDAGDAAGAAGFLPDGIAMAKSLGGGFPMGAFWVRQSWADLLGPGSHGSTYGGSPLACAVGLKVLEVIEREHLADQARRTGEFLNTELSALVAKYPRVISRVRGLGLMIGIELADNIPAFSGTDKAPAIQFVARLHDAGMLAIPAGTRIIRVLPALNLPREDAAEGVRIIEAVAAKLSA